MSPRDVVPAAGARVEDLIGLLRLEGRTVTVSTPGRVSVDAAGVPTGIDPPTAEEATVAPCVFTPQQWEAVARHLLAQIDNNNDEEGTRDDE